MLRRKVAALAVVCAAVGSGCSSGQPSDELMVTDKPVAAVAAVSPPTSVPPAGAVTPLSGTPTALVVDRDVLAVAVAEPPSVLLYRLGDADTLSAPKTVPLSAPADTLSVDGDTLLAALGKSGELVRISLDGKAKPAATISGETVSAVRFEGRTLVAVRDRRAVAVLGGDKIDRMITGDLMSADQVLSTGEHAVVLDRLRNAVFQLDVRAGTVGQGLRAGQGATNAVTDRFGRVLVTDTRGGALLAFSLDPLLLRQNYPVPGAPYAIAYDPKRDLAWVTLTETNEVVGYEIAGEEPKEKYRFPSVAQPDSVTVDPSSGRVVVASGTGKGIQVISI